MPQDRTTPRAWSLLLPGGLLLLVSVLVACGNVGQTEWALTPTATPVLSSPTIAPTSVPTRPVFVAPGKEAGATRIAQKYATYWAGVLQTATVLALTPPGSPTSTPEPWLSPTPAMGSFICGDPANPREPNFATCWRGYVNGELISVGTGRLGRDHDPNIGVLLITPWEYPVPGVPQSETYYSPAYRGSIRITSVEGTVVYLIAADHQTTFAFDLATRQWLFSTPTAAPIPTLLLTP